jgi:hypothetical protein
MRYPPATPDLVVEGSKRCPHCGRVKPLGAFYRRRADRQPSSWCKTCSRIERASFRETPEYRDWLAVHLARPDVRQRRREADRKRLERRRLRKREYNATIWGKLLHCRRQARRKLRVTSDETRRVALRCLIDQYEAELVRLAFSEGRPFCLGSEGRPVA